MDVSWSEAQRAETNVIARSDDRATTIWGIRAKGTKGTYESYANNLIYKKVHIFFANMCTFFSVVSVGPLDYKFGSGARRWWALK
jgi:hypothetical protein